ncbi:phosphatase PAP2 family protein [Paenibacillus whitsoniae]|uniref:Phosphatase PAP2 family protein n=1 Tax=Paenibacillus whitsoniae TaxID=2496558 RepID=A0A430JDW5_9BACL|nr:phosphatase PAP2 family protein [Paenibacillus whitsoniae]RTE09226.1 phosphatase PAP2 family protein [Paenibacillus whitsoniae]
MKKNLQNHDYPSLEGSSQPIKFKFRLAFALVLSIVCATGFGLIGVIISEKHINYFDEAIITSIQGHESPMITCMMKVFTFIGGGIPVGIITILAILFLYFVLHHRVELTLLIAVVIGSALINTVLKTAYHRSRPMIHRIIEANGFSYPSGHSMTAFSLYGVLAFLLWRHIKTSSSRITLVVLSSLMVLLIGVSRIYLGVHYPTDVLGGFLASGCWLTVAIWFYQWLQEKRWERRKFGQ